jgi:hypothetical protein
MKWKEKAKFLRSIGMPEWWIAQKREDFYKKNLVVAPIALRLMLTTPLPCGSCDQRIPSDTEDKLS